MGHKKNKFAFGVFQDGLTVKVAELVSIDGMIKILRLGKMELSAPLYPKPAEISEEYVALEEVEEKEQVIEDFDEIAQLNQLENLEVPDQLEGEKLPVTEEEIPTYEPAADQEEVINGKKDLQKLLQSFPLEKGRLALNVNEEQVSYHQFDSAFATSRLRKKLKTEILSKEEIKSRNYALDYLINPNGSGLAFVHRGPFELLNAIQEINPVISREKYIYSYIETNEIALMNLVRNCYDFPPEDFVTILYIGNDYRAGIVTKDKNHIKTFPIIITETDPDKKRQAIYSKIILEQDISNTPITQHVILAGEDVSDEDVEFFQEKGFYWDPLKRLELKNIELVETEGDVSPAEKIAQYAIPIALAWKTLDPKNPNFFPTNLLPPKIIESQKYFKIAWHGFLVLAAIFYFTLSGTLKNLELKQQITEIKQKTTQVQNELTQVKRLIAAIDQVKAKMRIIQDKNKLVKQITGDKNQWSFILADFSSNFRQNKLSWLENMQSRKDNFEITGKTTRRRNIIDISQLFPASQIKKINPTFVQGIPIWDFNITCNYPDPQDRDIPAQVVQKTVVISEPQPQPQPEPEGAITEDEITLLYRTIINIYFAGHVQEAHQRFREFREKYPTHQRAYNAGYFIGECLYLEGDIPAAKKIFADIIRKPGSKVPDALMMLGQCHERENDPQTALGYWNRLVNEYPNHDLAPLARFKINSYQG